MHLSIIIVNWNSVGYLRKCLASVYEQTAGLEFEVVVVDNASFDGCGEMLAAEFPQVRFVQSPGNLGFAGANNLGVAHAKGRSLLFLNPDTEVIGDAVRTLFAALESLPDVGVVGAKLLNSDRTTQTSCIQRFPTIVNLFVDSEVLRNAFPSLRIWGTWPLLEKQEGPVAVEVISGACMVMRRNAFEKAGGFSTDYFMYCEDVDLCYQSRMAGFANYYVDGALVIHHGGGSTGSGARECFSAVAMRDSISKFLALRRGRAYASVYRLSVLLASTLRCILLGCGVLVRRQDGRLRQSLARWAAVFRWAAGAASAV